MRLAGNADSGNMGNRELHKRGVKVWEAWDTSKPPMVRAIIENTGVIPDVAGKNIQQYRAARLVRITMRHGRFVDHRNAG